ncbi:hypothetical protein HPB48_000669 [Haemaphysalis longicornis]|uniref:Uncharacterized protein n=1 Tax=Haemaphysalis longicornis TaxID=44386 RepID=A0A9J6FQE5_HAELO|nr:hypothetical protein HPB48_000669 [Haemaphysalis longicornis]
MLVQLKGTRWLSISSCCKRILEKKDKRKLQFTMCKENYRCYDVDILYKMYRDPDNLYFMLLNPVLQELWRVEFGRLNLKVDTKLDCLIAF